MAVSYSTCMTELIIDAALVGELICAQFPRWAGLAVEPLERDGWDNRTFRLGERLAVRLPSAECYAEQVEKEQYWLPRLAPRLPLPIPVPVAMGLPARGYPWHWSVSRWLEGEDATIGRIDDALRFATELARFLVALQRIDSTGGPRPGRHNFWRGGPLATYDAETRGALSTLRGRIDSTAAAAVWESALDATWHGTPVWIHGDVAAANLLVTEGRFSAVIDFGCTGVGDPACDLTIAWTLFSGKSREAFRAGLPLDDATWTRGRGWALWKALITAAGLPGTNPLEAAKAQRVLEEVLSDPGGA